MLSGRELKHNLDPDVEHKSFEPHVEPIMIDLNPEIMTRPRRNNTQRDMYTPLTAQEETQNRHLQRVLKQSAKQAADNVDNPDAVNKYVAVTNFAKTHQSVRQLSLDMQRMLDQPKGMGVTSSPLKNITSGLKLIAVQSKELVTHGIIAQRYADRDIRLKKSDGTLLYPQSTRKAKYRACVAEVVIDAQNISELADSLLAAREHDSVKTLFNLRDKLVSLSSEDKDPMLKLERKHWSWAISDENLMWKPPLISRVLVTMVPTILASQFTTPETYRQAITGPQADRWLLAIHNELQSLNENNTFEIVDLPSGERAIGSKWVFKIKENRDGTIDKFKARLPNPSNGYLKCIPISHASRKRTYVYEVSTGHGR
jgi:hypothetical protein